MGNINQSAVETRNPNMYHFYHQICTDINAKIKIKMHDDGDDVDLKAWIFIKSIYFDPV